MALWPFGKNSDNNKNGDSGKPENSSQDHQGVDSGQDLGSSPAEKLEDNQDKQPETLSGVASAEPGMSAKPASPVITSTPHDPVKGEMGPFDGDVVSIDSFDFSDFSLGTLDLGSLKIPLPKKSQVQVEMGESGPRMLHIVTEYGRITPVAFAAPRSSGQWASSAKDLIQGVAADGLDTHVENGPWGSEIVGKNANGTIRIIGIEGPRWLLRLTLAAPEGKQDNLAQLAREVAARTFVYRGDEPILAGNSLTITMPPPLVEQIQEAMTKRQAQQQPPQPTEAEQEAIEQMRKLRAEQSPALSEQPTEQSDK